MPSMPGADVFRAITDPTRRELLTLLLAAELSVQQMTERFPMSMGAISQHLAVLRSAGLVAVKARGRQRLYSLQSRPLEEVDQWLAPFRQVQDPFGHRWTLTQANGDRREASTDAQRRGTLAQSQNPNSRKEKRGKHVD